MNLEARLKILREKPEHIRKRYALSASLGITTIIFIFWISSFSFTTTRSQSSIATALNNAGSPGRSMVAAVGTFFVDIKEIIFGAKKIDYATVEASPGTR